MHGPCTHRAGQVGNVQWYGIRGGVEVAHFGKEKWENITVACNASGGTGLIFQFLDKCA